MHYHVGPMLNRANKVWGTESIIYNKDDAVFMGNIRHSLNIHKVDVRITDGFHINRFSAVIDSFFKSTQIIRINEFSRNAKTRQSGAEQSGGCDNVIAGTGYVFNRVSNSCRTGTYG